MRGKGHSTQAQIVYQNTSKLYEAAINTRTLIGELRDETPLDSDTYQQITAIYNIADDAVNAVYKTADSLDKFLIQHSSLKGRQNKGIGKNERKNAYRLTGTLSIQQHCYDDPHPIIDRPNLCHNPTNCEGHSIIKFHTEVVEADTEGLAIDMSMSMYEGANLEPIWEPGYPKIQLITEQMYGLPTSPVIDQMPIGTRTQEEYLWLFERGFVQYADSGYVYRHRKEENTCIVTRVPYKQRYNKETPEDPVETQDWDTFFTFFCSLEDYQRDRWVWVGNEPYRHLSTHNGWFCYRDAM